MFEHSVKVPRHYKVAANIFKKVSTEGGSVKTLLYDNKLRHFRTNVLFALITETVKHAGDIDKIFESSEILKNESRLDPWLAKVLTAELLFGKKALPGKSKPEQTVLAYKEQFEKYTSEHQDELKTEVAHRPRYVRINTNLLTTSDAIRSFQDEGYRFIRCTSGSYNDYLQQIQGLTEYDFTQDYHVKTIFVFPHGTKLHEHELYLENQIILQDKATAMAVHLLAPPPGSVVLDMCAAPGMKTTQVAAYMRNEGKIYAVERNEKRFQTLTDFVNKTGCKCVELINKDTLEIRKGEYDDVEYILLDPSCSGSGMEFTVHNYIEDTRLAKLTSLQEKFLKHAMNAFPNAKRIVYSTCSLFPEENERVITNVVKNARVKWRVQDVKEILKEQWNNFGSGMYGSMGTRCLYARPDSDLTTGFFLAVLDRDPADLEKAKNDDKNVNVEITSTKNVISKKEKYKNNDELDEDPVTQTDDSSENIKKKKKKKKPQNELENNSVIDTNTVTNENDTSSEYKKKKSKRKHEENATEPEVTTDVKKKKKKKKQHEEGNESFGNVDTGSIINEDNNNQEGESQTVKKKKKKHKTEAIEEESINVENNEVQICMEYNTDNSKKKKKKKHKSYGHENSDVLQMSSENHILQEVNMEDEHVKNNIELGVKQKKKKRDKNIKNES
ncbi:28S rRNA (cytosine-C(5))-methyltransferase [Epargyreus clarus]|uniref:28S rRNA (cytosine-C(5))-methyltransferase n=1 Tax=Epargyreus clarus TaxID=520877 RepID=UPI003C2EA8FA